MEHHLAKLRDAATRAALESVDSRQPIEHELSRIRFLRWCCMAQMTLRLFRTAPKNGSRHLGIKARDDSPCRSYINGGRAAAINAALCAFVKACRFPASLSPCNVTACPIRRLPCHPQSA